MLDEIIARTIRLTNLQALDDAAEEIEDQLLDVANYSLFLLLRDDGPGTR